MTKISLASDHAGFEYKEAIKLHLESKGITIEDFGTYSAEPVDYPKFVHAAAQIWGNRRARQNKYRSLQ